MKNLKSTKIKSLSTQIEKFKLLLTAKHSEFKLLKEELGNGKYHTGEGYSVKVHDNVVVTILDEEIKQPTPTKKKKTNRSKKLSYEPTLKEQLKDIA